MQRFTLTLIYCEFNADSWDLTRLFLLIPRNDCRRAPWRGCLLWHSGAPASNIIPQFSAIYRAGTSRSPTLLIASISSARSFFLVLFFSPFSCFFMPHSSHHPYAYHFHGALIPTAFVVDVAITCGVLQWTQWTTYSVSLCFLISSAHVEWTQCNRNATNVHNNDILLTSFSVRYEEAPMYTLHCARVPISLIESVYLVRRCALTQTSTNIMHHDSHAVSSLMSHSLGQTWTRTGCWP
jgi:hypothetical protein